MPESNSKIIYSIVIPCYQSGNWLEELVEEVDSQMSEYQNHWELLLVDDSSPDSGITRNCIERIAARYENASGIILQFNSGQTAALRCGYARAKGEFVITMADDFQIHRPRYLILLMLQMIIQMLIVFLASRRKRSTLCLEI